MLRKIIFCAFFISFVITDKDEYLPMNKDSKYGDDVCRYYDDGHYYVKPCEKGKYCAHISELNRFDTYLEICQDLPNMTIPLSLNENECSSTFECESGLTCNGKSCTHECSTGEFWAEKYSSSSSSSSGCAPNILKSTTSGYCLKITYTKTTLPYTYSIEYSEPEKNKECGKYTITQYPDPIDKGFYEITANEYVYPGSVEDGEYVSKKELCKSGYALYFYYNGVFDDPRPTGSSSSQTNERYLRCITPISINPSASSSGECTIKYKLDGKEYFYNVEQLNSPYKGRLRSLCSLDNIHIRTEKYREFYSNINEERDTCGDLDGVNKYTCENRELIKSWFYYKNPDKYILFNERDKFDKVVDYVIQKEYPTYYGFSQYLNIHMFLFLLILLF